NELSEQISRYTFLRAQSYMRLEAHVNEIVLHHRKRKEQRQGSALQIAKELLRQHRPAAVPGLPPFTAGAVGYCSYDIVRQLESIGEHTKDDLSLPDCMFMFFDRLLAFDDLRHQIHIIATADVSAESSRQAYNRAVRDIGILEKKLAAGLRPGLWQKSSRRLNSKLKIRSETSRQRFIESVQRAKEYIAAGDVFQVVLSLRLDFTPEVAPFDTYRALRTVNPSPYMYFLPMGDTHIL